MKGNYDSYRIFYYVGKYQNITRAASALFLSQSTVSRAMLSLESAMGCQLLQRRHDGVRLTAEGEILFQHVELAFQNLSRAEDELAQRRHDPTGSLRIGVTDVSFAEFVLPILGSFRDDYPHVQVNVISSGFYSSRQMCDALKSGKTDVACMAAAELNPETDNMIRFTPVAEYNEIAVAHRRFEELRHTHCTFEQLSSYPFASLMIENQSVSYLERVALKQNHTITPAFTADSVTMFLAIVKTCPCVALLPSLYREQIRSDPDLFELAMDEIMPHHTIHILTPESVVMSDMLADFIARLEQAIRIRVKAVSTG